MPMSKARVTELTVWNVGMRGPPPAMNSAGGWGWNDRPPWEPHHTNWPMQPPPGDMVVSACYSIQTTTAIHVFVAAFRNGLL